ncbi:ATP synthase F1 subunit epsilon [Rhabdothermincola sp.]|uniref:ATP synthase F1 subunit epsilon n=1 Tax=Rhabdothermincola sp. TaxID=2820405 RepID=UPI002FE05D57
MPLHVELVSPERTLLSAEATMVQARTIGGGDIAFLPGHAPFIGALAIHPVSIRLTDGREEIAAVHGGFIEVSNDQVKILSDMAELSSQIDVERARRAQERAEEAIRRGDDVTAQAALQRAHARLAASGRPVA